MDADRLVSPASGGSDPLVVLDVDVATANRRKLAQAKTGVLTPGYNSLGQPYALSGSQAYVNAAFYNYLGKPSEVRLANGLSQRSNYFGVDTPAAFGTSQFGRLRQISGSRKTRTLRISRKRWRLPARTSPRNLQRPCPP